MRKRILLAIVAGGSLWAQTPAQPPAPNAAAQLASLPPEAVFATVGGEKVTVQQVRDLMRRVPPNAQSNIPAVLRQWAQMRRLAAMAEEGKLLEQSPWKENFEWTRMQFLATAQMNHFYRGIAVSPDDLAKRYEINRNRYEQAKFKMLYIGFGASAAGPDGKAVTEDAAKAKIEDLLKQARGGADFSQLAREHSQEKSSAARGGDYGAAVRRSAQLPEPIKTAVFALKPGEVSEPVRQPNGFYLFRLDEITVAPLAEVRAEVEKEIRDGKLTDWMQNLGGQLEVKLESPAPAAPQAAPAQPAK